MKKVFIVVTLLLGITLVAMLLTKPEPQAHYDAVVGLDIRGQPADTRTVAQKASLRKLLEQLHERYPRAVIVGHHDLNPLKACPCFDAAHEYKRSEEV
jgi:ABC-type cobalamin transport system ATPase subunit